MIFNFYLPDEVISGMYGDCMRTPEEKEEMEKIFYSLFLSGLCVTHPKQPDILEFIASVEICGRLEEAANLIPVVIKRSMDRIGGNE